MTQLPMLLVGSRREHALHDVLGFTSIPHVQDEGL